MDHQTLYTQALGELRKAIAGQDLVLRQVLIALFTGGHVLLEGVPGVAKTLLVRALGLTFTAPFKRVQFTPDLMPADLIGINVFHPEAQEFRLRKGPIFTSFLLADEVNRTPPKTQAALLEAMQERTVTIDGETHVLPHGFTVFATQNPVEYEGTYPLPEAQLDRFLMKVLVPYPNRATEIEMLQRHVQGFNANLLETTGIQPIGGEDAYVSLRAASAQIRVAPEIQGYLADLLIGSRGHELVLLGASPRAGVALLQTARTVAALEGRDYVVPDDIKEVIPAVWRHRLILRPEAEIEGISADRVLTEILERVPVPR